MKPRHFVLAAALAVLSSPALAAAAPPAEMMRGVCWEGARQIDATSLAPLHVLGANWNEESEHVGFWDELDFIGVQAYYPLADADRPSKKKVAAKWVPIAAKLAALSKRTGKTIVFTEVGFKSHEGSLKKPWLWETNGAVDVVLQRDAFAAMFETFWTKSWFGGAFVWKWHPSLRPGGRHDRDFTPQGKPALSVIKAYYTAR